MRIVITQEQIEDILDEISIKIPRGYVLSTDDGIHYHIKKNQDDKEKEVKRAK